MKAKPILVTRIPIEYRYEGMKAIIGNVYKICKRDYLALFTSGAGTQVEFEVLSVESATPADLQLIEQLIVETSQLFKERIHG